jgi:hypothetical protein
MPNSTSMRVLLPLLVSLMCALPAAAQESTPRASGESTPPVPISDNSFLVEEAYNQEAGVVQHIGTYRRDRDRGWAATFTQEWPAPSQSNQLSYTLILQSVESGSGLGDIAINYRRQVLGKDEEPVWFSPRLSVILPAGSFGKGTGAGGPGAQVNLPLSVQVAPSLVTHWNAGATVIRARNEGGDRNTIRAVNAAVSSIWLVTPTFNFILESAWDRVESLNDAGGRETTTNFVLLPGVRGAINLPTGMQIVPGVGVAFGVGPSRGQRDLFLYLSVEHPFR